MSKCLIIVLPQTKNLQNNLPVFNNAFVTHLIFIGFINLLAPMRHIFVSKNTGCVFSHHGLINEATHCVRVKQLVAS